MNFLKLQFGSECSAPDLMSLTHHDVFNLSPNPVKMAIRRIKLCRATKDVARPTGLQD